MNYSGPELIFSGSEPFVLCRPRTGCFFASSNEQCQTQTTKKMKTFAHMLVAAIIIATSACSKSDDSASTDDLSATLKKEIITDTWVIGTYIDKGRNETSNYTGYSFTFSNNGILTATVSGTRFTGTWSIGSDHSGSDDSGHHSGDDNKLILTISGNYQMEELTDDFMIVRISENEIVLKDDNPAKIKELVFKRS